MKITTIQQHQQALSKCQKCAEMYRPVIMGKAINTPIISIGQAPGVREADFAQPFAWTAGKTLFKWFETIGINEQQYRQNIYMAAVCRCYPGKNPKSGDRVPNKQEIENCEPWLAQEFTLLKPKLIIPIGKLATANAF